MAFRVTIFPFVQSHTTYLDHIMAVYMLFRFLSTVPTTRCLRPHLALDIFLRRARHPPPHVHGIEGLQVLCEEVSNLETILALSGVPSHIRPQDLLLAFPLREILKKMTPRLGLVPGTTGTRRWVGSSSTRGEPLARIGRGEVRPASFLPAVPVFLVGGFYVRPRLCLLPRGVGGRGTWGEPSSPVPISVPKHPMHERPARLVPAAPTHPPLSCF